MDKVLFINACVRGGKSRTLKITREFIREYQRLHPADPLTELNLCDLNLHYLTGHSLEQRKQLLQKGSLNHDYFKLARQFAAADKIIIAAPFWDLSFPAVLKVYIEHISVDGITFKYENNLSIGICRAKKLLYITTRGGEFSHGYAAELEMGERYIRALCTMYGIKNVLSICADGLDVAENDSHKIINNAIEKAIKISKSF